MTTSGFQNQLSPQDSQRFQDLYRSGNYSGAHGMVSGFAPRTVSVNPWFPYMDQSTYGAQNNIFNQYLAYFGLTDSGVTGHISNPPGQQSGQQPPVSFPQTPPSVLPPQQSGSGSFQNFLGLDVPDGPLPATVPDWVIDTDPAMAYQTFLGNSRAGRSQGSQRFLESQYQDVYGGFLADLGRQITEGVIPTTSFYNEYLPANFNPADYERQFNPQDRGQGTRQFNPQTQFNFRR